mgnify:CR=1 FL=1
MRDEYDFSKGIRGKYAKRYPEGSKAVLLDPEVAKEFPDAAAVNEALRQVLRDRKKTSGSATTARPVPSASITLVW